MNLGRISEAWEKAVPGDGGAWMCSQCSPERFAMGLDTCKGVPRTIDEPPLVPGEKFLVPRAGIRGAPYCPHAVPHENCRMSIGACAVVCPDGAYAGAKCDWMDGQTTLHIEVEPTPEPIIINGRVVGSRLVVQARGREA
jgi:hypothetical protein